MGGAAAAVAAGTTASPATAQPPTLQPTIEVVNKIPKAFLSVIRSQFKIIQTWMDPILKLSQAFPEAEHLKVAAQITDKNYRQILNLIEKFNELDPDEVE